MNGDDGGLRSSRDSVGRCGFARKEAFKKVHVVCCRLFVRDLLPSIRCAESMRTFPKPVLSSTYDGAVQAIRQPSPALATAKDKIQIQQLRGRISHVVYDCKIHVEIG